MPREVPRGVHVLYASRRVPAVRDGLYLQLQPDTARDEMELGGLSLEDTRALLYECSSKYELRAEYAEQLCELSDGNPLYLTLLCGAAGRRRSLSTTSPGYRDAWKSCTSGF